MNDVSEFFLKIIDFSKANHLFNNNKQSDENLSHIKDEIQQMTKRDYFCEKLYLQ